MYYFFQACGFIGLSSDSDTHSSAGSDDTESSEAEVTIRALHKKSGAGEELVLYHLIAGKVEDLSTTGHALLEFSTRTIRDNWLFELIDEQCSKDLLGARVAARKVTKLLHEGPSFIVTDTMPREDEDDLSSIAIKPVVSIESDMDVYEYIHQKDESLKVRIHEPKSPPKVEYVCDENVQRESAIIKDVSGDDFEKLLYGHFNDDQNIF